MRYFTKSSIANDENNASVWRRMKTPTPLPGNNATRYTLQLRIIHCYFPSSLGRDGFARSMHHAQDKRRYVLIIIQSLRKHDHRFLVEGHVELLWLSRPTPRSAWSWGLLWRPALSSWLRTRGSCLHELLRTLIRVESPSWCRVPLSHSLHAWIL